MLLLNGALALIQVIGAPLVAAYYRQPMITEMLRVQALLYLATPFIAVPYALLAREMDFRKQAKVNLTSSLASAGTALGGALAWAAWVGAASGRSGVSWTDVGFEIQGDTAVAVTYDVTKDPGDTAVCSLRALDRNKTAIGVARVTVGPSSSRTTRTSARSSSPARSSAPGAWKSPPST